MFKFFHSITLPTWLFVVYLGLPLFYGLNKFLTCDNDTCYKFVLEFLGLYFFTMPALGFFWLGVGIYRSLNKKNLFLASTPKFFLVLEIVLGVAVFLPIIFAILALLAFGQ